MWRYITIVFICLTVASCQPETYTPKHPGYYKIDLPTQHTYQQLNLKGYPYTFEYPTYAKIIRDTSFFGEKPENPYWINIVFPSIGGVIYISYKQISPRQPLSKLLEDAHELSYFHTKKADYIDDNMFRNAYGVSGILYSVGGNAASSYQFIATDSVKNFIRGALYFNVTPNADSLKPVNDFAKADILHLLKTIKWQ